LGENGKVVVLSVPEGDDKPIKYPAIFARSKVLLINKIDMLKETGLVDFDIERVKAHARKLNDNIKIFLISAKTGDGFADWCRWLSESVRNLQ
jgi:hydrogenase nickel incorporation protein HypB